jgi:deazaflavin-dependent oxidoreductase (nitroreductase family)
MVAFNRVALPFAGRRRSPFAVIYHVGRRSGQAYTTPVVARPVSGGFVIPLPYGATVDWVRNLQARGQGRLKWHGQIYEVGAPQVLNRAEGLAAFGGFQRWASRQMGIRQFLRLPHRTSPGGLSV